MITEAPVPVCPRCSTVMHSHGVARSSSSGVLSEAFHCQRCNVWQWEKAETDRPALDLSDCRPVEMRSGHGYR